MAAALIRRGTKLCCFHREMCRLVWRPQTALLSSKPSNRNQPRKTHIKKAKPQPAVDITKLLEQLFSQPRPGTAPPPARRAKDSSGSTKPPTSSSVNASTSDLPPSSKTAPVASAFPAATSNTLSPLPQSASPNTSQTPQQSDFTQTFAAESVSSVTVSPASASPASLGSAKEIITETSVETTTAPPAAEVESSLETTPGSPVEPSVETPASRAEGPVESAGDEVQTKDFHSTKEEPLTETTIDPPVETSHFPAAETGEAAGVEGPVEPAVNVVVLAAVSANSGAANISHSAAVKPSLETTAEPPVEPTISSPLPETAESGSAAAESPVESTVDAQTNITDSGHANLPHTAAVETIIETTIEPSAETSASPLETRESRPAVEASVETKIETESAQVGQINSSDSGMINVSFSAKQAPLIETAEEPAAEAPLESRAAASEGSVENKAADDLSHATLIQNTQESAPTRSENEVEATVESESGSVAVEERANKSEQMTLESVTLHAVEVQVESLRTDELLQAKSVLDEKAEKQLEELLAETTAAGAAETGNSSEVESLTEVLSKWDSLSEDLRELEGESGTLVKELLCHVPAVKTSSASGLPSGANGEPLQTEEKGSEAEAMTLESLTLAKVKAEVGGLETEVLLETRNALEKEAEVRAKEEKMEVVTTTEEDVAVFEDTTEAEILTLDSISEATDAIEAETAVMLEAMFGSEQGPNQPSDTGDAQKLKQEAEKEESGGQGGSVREAMSLESVTLAEVEAALGALENETLSETSDYLEKEAEILAGEKKVEVKDSVVSEEATKDLKIESLSEADDLPEALQMDALMEELLFSVPGHVKREKESQEVARENNSEAAVGVGSVDADTAAAVTDDDFPAVEEVLLGQEAEGKTSENEDGEGTHADLDPVQRLFLEKIREYNNMRRLNGGPLEVEPDYEKLLSEETAKLQRLYGGGDLSNFPEFTFTEPQMDQDSK